MTNIAIGLFFSGGAHLKLLQDYQSLNSILDCTKKFPKILIFGGDMRILVYLAKYTGMKRVGPHITRIFQQQNVRMSRRFLLPVPAGIGWVGFSSANHPDPDRLGRLLVVEYHYFFGSRGRLLVFFDMYGSSGSASNAVQKGSDGWY